MTDFDSNTFENDYILKVLSHMVTELTTEKSVEQILDKYAVELTAFMNGQIRAVVQAGSNHGVKDTSGWLIERNVNGHAEWMVNLTNIGTEVYALWTTDSFVAIRFSRKRDAETLLRNYPTFGDAFATEHIWADEEIT